MNVTLDKLLRLLYIFALTKHNDNKCFLVVINNGYKMSNLLNTQYTLAYCLMSKFTYVLFIYVRVTPFHINAHHGELNISENQTC